MTDLDPIQAPGTPEARWRGWPGFQALPRLPLPAEGTVVVIAAHPDDEVLGFGGTMARLAADGLRVVSVCATDGEGSHPGSRAMSAGQLARARAKELDEALARLGVTAPPHRLGLPDSGLARHETELTRALLPLVAGAALVAAPYTGDRHPDHEATGRAAVAAAAHTGVRLVQYPVWAWHWSRPEDRDPPWHGAARVDLDTAARRRKARAVAAFTTQIHPLGPAPEDAAILPPSELDHHLRPWETVFP
ncbi:PIG-L deacetylase family protein [Streptomyces sp. SM14]|uniref:PIG-L deacetylase family protein n=2 Tax=unclassified Streptomyces TaxID=2593676 RepID=UPI000CD55996|nr:PIG-L family deacetylase [Streptomyces sp. SM14]